MHGESTNWAKDKSSVIKELVGKWLFALYAVFYVGFIVINVASPDFMGIDIGGLNMAIGFGFGLIVLAMLLAFAYNHISTKAETVFSELNEQKTDDDEAETDV